MKTWGRRADKRCQAQPLITSEKSDVVLYKGSRNGILQMLSQYLSPYSRISNSSPTFIFLFF